MAAREEAALSARASGAPGSLQTPCWDSSLVTRAAPRLSGASCSVEWSWMPTAERRGEPRSWCCRAEPHRHQSLPGPEPSARGEPAGACPREKGPLGPPGPHLRCRQLGPSPCPPQGLGGSSSPQPLPPAPPPPAKPPAHAARSLPPAQRAAAQAGPAATSHWGPQPPPPHHGAVPCARGPGWRTAGRQSPLPALPSPLASSRGSGEWLGAGASASPGVGSHHLPCLLQLSPSPQHQRDLPRGSLWDTNQCSRATCDLTGLQAAAPQDPKQGMGPQMGHTRRCQAPGLPVPLPPCCWQHLPLPCLGPWLLRALRAHSLGPGQHCHGGAEDAGVAQLPPPLLWPRVFATLSSLWLGSLRLSPVTRGTVGPACGRRPCWAALSCLPAPGWPHRTRRHPRASWPGSSGP